MKKNASIQVLRMILMYFILLFHLIGHGSNVTSVGINAFLTDSFFNGKLTLYSLLIFPVDCFLLISGFYGITFKIKKIINLWITALIISLLVTLFNSFITLSFIPKNLIKGFLPISSNTWWFLTYYIMLNVLSPLLNKVNDFEIKNRKMYFCFLLIIDFLFREPLLNFIICYLIGIFLREYNLSRKDRLFILLITLLYVNVVLFLSFYKKNVVFLLLSSYSPFIILQAVLVFDIFKSYFFENKWLDLCGSTAFSVYLISDHPIVRNQIANYIKPYVDSVADFNVLYLLFYGTIIFLGCLFCGCVLKFFLSIVEKNLPFVKREV